MIKMTSPTGVHILARPLSIAAIAVAIAFSSFAGAQVRTDVGNLTPGQMSAVPTDIPEAISRSSNLGPLNPNKMMKVFVSLEFGDPQGIAEFNDSVSDPKSPNYRHFLTPEQIGERFGLPYSRVQSVVDYLTSQGLTIKLVAKNRLGVRATGTVAQMEKAFGVKLNQYHTLSPFEDGARDFYSYSTPVKLPSTIAGDIVNVEGLQNFTQPRPRVALTPTQVRTLYGLDPIYSAPMRGEGRKVGISNWDGYRLTNVPLYYSHFSLPTPTGGVGNNITEVHLDGGSSAGTPASEGDLDIQMVLGMAPLCDFTIYDGGTGSGVLIDVLAQEANDNKCDIISESWGWNLGTSSANAAHDQHVAMTALGITYMAASGDSGTSIEPFSYPNYDGEVLMVGGTIASINGSNVRTNEVNWSGSGGGWSTKAVAFNVLPSWQVGTGVPVGNNHRLSPDVALQAHGGNDGAYPFYFGGSLSTGFIGTSFACPVFAGSLAIAEQKLISLGGLPADGNGKRRFGRIQDLIYSQNGNATIWFDVIAGNNTGTLPDSTTASAHAGWDFTTGWGCIDFDKFVTSIQIPSVSGNIKQSGVGVPGVTVKLMQGVTEIDTTTTNASGDYTLHGNAGNYTIVPSHNDKYFFPSSKSVTLPDATSENFTAANNGPVSITPQYSVVYAQSRQVTLGLAVTTPVQRDITFSDNSTKLTSPIKVTVPAGQRTVNFFVYGTPVTVDTLVTMTATHQGIMATGTITVRKTPVLTTMTLATTTKGGVGKTGSVTIDKPAVGAMSLVIDTNNHTVATCSPSNTAMPHNATTKSFYLKTFPVAVDTNITVTATFYGSTVQKNVLVTH